MKERALIRAFAVVNIGSSHGKSDWHARLILSSPLARASPFRNLCQEIELPGIKTSLCAVFACDHLLMMSYMNTFLFHEDPRALFFREDNFFPYKTARYNQQEFNDRKFSVVYTHSYLSTNNQW